MKPILLSALGISAAGGVATGAYFLIPENKSQTTKTEEITPKNVSEFISKKGWTPLDKATDGGDKAKWEKLIEKYTTISKQTDKKITVEGFKEGAGNKDANVKALQATCDKLFEITTDLENNSEIAKEWCTKQSSNLTL